MSAPDRPLIDMDHLKSWVGREDTGSEILSEELARKYHAMLDMPGAPPAHGAAAPQLIHFCLAQPAVATAGLGPDGHPARGGFLPPVPLPRRMWAGGALTFHHDLKVGDLVRRVSRVADVSLKEGRTGPLCFVTVAHRIEANGVLAIDERQDIVYRGADSGGAGKSPPAAESGAFVEPVAVGAPLLFRYSALTFNAHRIHYDRSYATEVEGYPALVVHGPMQAALLRNFATKLRGAPPRRFSFRGLAPLFDTDTVALHARAEGDGLVLWTARDRGPVSMAAEATW
ncbi:FAS1-like dehydratase domain-containing protein [Propylenella binzhouense]|uniref:Protein dehydratase n=1 Tax=Propylenella binzhouense TaxID=2555902 RepID=A0A964WRZ6_9HYPH|nr:MaoC family dehydratase N-terminal domain-containing protein [Propylenella binzhouense]MYZ46326.1 protein dehydratase [Propylenella binzhouense]